MESGTFRVKAEEAIENNERKSAVEFYTFAIMLNTADASLYQARGRVNIDLERWEDALADAQKVIELDPSNAQGYELLGAAFDGLREFDRATEAYDKSQMLLRHTCDVSGADRHAAGGHFQAEWGPDIFQQIQSHPRLAGYLNRSDYIHLIRRLLLDPSTESQVKDSRLAFTLRELRSLRQKMSGNGLSGPILPPRIPFDDDLAEAKALKEEGNILYKRRMFSEALEKYRAAAAKDPSNTTILLNCTAVYFEQAEFETCLRECIAALEHGREHQCDYKIVSKLLTRQALCLQRLNRHAEAIVVFKKALVEFRNPDTLEKLRLCEKEKEKLDADAYINPEIAAQKKQEGNELFKNAMYPAAIEAYSEAIKRNPTEHTVYSNRAAAYLKLGAYNEALKDCEKCLEINPTFTRAYARKGHAYFWTKQYNRALQTYEEGLKLDPTNEECREGKMRTIMKIQEMASGQAEDGDEAARRAMADPEIAAIMQDSYMQMVLSEMSRDPSRVQDYMRDATIASKIEKLITAGIIRFGGSAPTSAA